MRKIQENKPESYHKGRSIIDTTHSIDRFLQKRGSDKSLDSSTFKFNILMTIKKGIDKIIKEYKDLKSVYVIHSNSTNIGVVIDWRRQSGSEDDGQNHAIIVSILPLSNKHFATHKDDSLLIVELANAFEKVVGKKVLKENNIKDHYSRIPSNFGFDIILWEGQVYDIDAIVVEV